MCYEMSVLLLLMGPLLLWLERRGAGKTTIARLLPRFWDVSQGAITVGGVDVRDLTSESLMKYVAFVFQDTFLFAESVADNIRLGNPGATMQDVIEAAKSCSGS